MLVDLIVIALLALAGGVVQTVTGFGNAIVMMLGFPNVFGITRAASVCGSISIVNNGTLTFTYRKHIDFKKTVVITTIYTIVSIVSINLAKVMDTDVIGFVYGIFLILLAAYFIFLNGKIKLVGPFWMVFSAVISGIGGGLFSIGGPLMAVYYSQIFDNREDYLGNLQFTFVVGGVISFITRIINGLYTVDLIKYTIVGIVFIYLGQLLGLKIASYLKPHMLRIIIYVVVLLSGIMTVVRYV